MVYDSMSLRCGPRWLGGGPEWFDDGLMVALLWSRDGSAMVQEWLNGNPSI